nr:MAG TPA: hypothetical protein [Caudoviricetes sp.]
MELSEKHRVHENNKFIVFMNITVLINLAKREYHELVSYG